MTDRRIEEAFAALQTAHSEAHKRDATAAFVGSVALARRLLAKVIEDGDRFVVIGDHRCSKDGLLSLQRDASAYRHLRDRAGSDLLDRLKTLPDAAAFDAVVHADMTPATLMEVIRG